MGGVAFLAASPKCLYGDSHEVAKLLMIESERELLRAHEISRKPGQSKIAQLSWPCHHLAQSFHSEPHVESPTGHEKR